jgi:hypothetical protein
MVVTKNIKTEHARFATVRVLLVITYSPVGVSEIHALLKLIISIVLVCVLRCSRDAPTQERCHCTLLYRLTSMSYAPHIKHSVRLPTPIRLWERM